MKSKLQVAIDGPVASGKSSVSKKLADRLGLLYVDTGAMYRALALHCDNKNIAWSDVSRVENLVSDTLIDLKRPNSKEKDGRGVTVRLESEDVTWKVRNAEIAEGASIVSQYAKVREVLGNAQQKLAQYHDVVMEGRDIGTRVLPNAQLKVFMTADVEQRVLWKSEQLKSRGHNIPIDQVKDGLVKRDNRELNRENDPLRPAKGAFILDSTDLTIDQVVEVIEGRIADLGFGDVYSGMKILTG